MKQYIEESHVEFWKNSSDIGRKEKVSRTLQFFLFVNSDSVLVLWTYGLNYIWKQNKRFYGFRFDYLWAPSTYRYKKRKSKLILMAILAVMNTRPEKSSGPHGIWTHDLCDTGAVRDLNSWPLRYSCSIGVLIHDLCDTETPVAVSQRSWVQIPYGSVLFITARIAIFVSSTAVLMYDFHVFTVIIHYLEGLFGSSITTSSRLAC